MHSKVISEIRRREIQRKKQEQELERERTKRTEDTIFEALDEEFNNCLKSFEMFSSFRISSYTAGQCYKFLGVAKGLGFEIQDNTSPVRAADDRYYELSIPAFAKGGKRTPAQKKMFTFVQQLKKDQKQKKAELFTECKRIQQQLEDGNYKYRYYNYTNKAEVSVTAEMFITTSFEYNMVRIFFQKLNILFYNYSCGEWIFTVYL